MNNAFHRHRENKSADFESLYNLYYEGLFRFAYNIIHNEDDCEDIVADSFVIIWEKWSSVKDLENLQAYLFIIVKNNCLKLLNKQAPFLDIIDEQLINLVITDDSPENIFLAKEFHQNLLEAINLLPERCKLIFLMIREEKLKYKEVAEILQISEKTVQAQLQIATRKIAEVIVNKE